MTFQQGRSDRGTARPSRLALVAALFIAAVVALGGGQARAGGDSREAKGRMLFAKGDYAAALEIYAELFGEHSDPLYLRNIGRCYQKLHQPGKAIDAFQEYLRRYKQIKKPERHEVEGFIQEMKKLQAEQAAEAAATPPPPPPKATAPPPAEPETPRKTTAASDDQPAATTPKTTRAPLIATAAEPRPARGSDKPLLTVTPEDQPTRPGTPESTPITHRWWFWTGIGAVLIGGAVAGFLVLRSPDRPPCQAGFTCPH
jgi:hypothetical protein